MALIPPLSRQEREKVQEELVVGHLAFKDLEAMIRAGDVDTVLTVFPDAQGRLMGKRVVGHYFFDHVAGEGLHACIYLFTVDIDMEPLPGFKLTSWEKGYGDMQMVPDMGTLRLIPWLPNTALVFCDVYTEERAHRGSAALGAAASGRACRRGRIYGQDRIRRPLPGLRRVFLHDRR
jgi:hypothetical protein